MRSIRYITIDPSLTRTAIYWPKGKNYVFSSVEREKKENREATLDRIYDELSCVARACGKIDLLVVEGYAFAANTRCLTQLAEVGGVVRLALYREFNAPILELPSTTWKKVTLGKGNLKKSIVLDLATMKYSNIWQNQDECDAYLMAQSVELALYSQEGRQEVLDLRSKILHLLGEEADA